MRSVGQPTANPLLAEIRLHDKLLAQTLARLRRDVVEHNRAAQRWLLSRPDARLAALRAGEPVVVSSSELCSC